MSTFEDKFLGKHKITQPKKENVNAIYGDLGVYRRRRERTESGKLLIYTIPLIDDRSKQC